MADGERDERCVSSSDSCPVCELCGAFDNLMICSGCKVSYYCSKEHQKDHWKDHKPTCKFRKRREKQEKENNNTSRDPESHRCVTSDNEGNAIGDVNQMTRHARGGACSAHSVDHTGNTCKQGEGVSEVSTDSESSGSQISKDENEKQDQNIKYLTKDNTGARPREKSEKTESSKMTQGKVYDASQQGCQQNSQTSPKCSLNTATARLKHKKQEAMKKTNPAASDQETKIADYVVKCLNDYGLCVVDHFMTSSKCEDILKDVQLLDHRGLMREGEVVYQGAAPGAKKIRGDNITWVEKGEKDYPNIGTLIQRLDSLLITCNGRLEQYDISGRTKAMVATYPGNGTYYMRHVDNPNQDGRCVTCIYYLNKDWDVQKDGGLLRIFPTQFSKVADIEPKFDRLLFFWSDRRNPHEVQPAYRTRSAITVWYFDKEERERARQRHLTNEANTSSLGMSPS